MSRKTRTGFTIGLVGLLLLTLGGTAGALIYAARLPDTLSEQETLMLGASRLIPGSPAALLIRVQEHGSGQAIADAEVEVQMRPSDGGRGEVLFVGTTDARGELRPTFTVPEVAEPAQTLVVRTRSAQGRDELEQSVTVERSYKVLLTTDKPLYQPGQVIHVRALAVSAFDRVPAADQPVELTIADAKGNKVYRQTAATSAYGVAAWDFQLASEVNAGAYKITATLADTTSERTVTVKPYVLPKFKVTASPDDTFYRPGDRVTGSVAATYFFGKPVAGGEVVLTGWTYDVERVQVLEVQGTTDETGTYPFEFDLPDYFVGAVEGAVSDFLLETAVTDGAGHTERVSLRIPVAQQGIIIEAVPESGVLKPGLENVLYLLTAYPDGAPAQCDVTLLLNGAEYTAQTGPYGLGELRVTPDSGWAELVLSAQDALGHVGEAELYLEGTSWGDEQILLRPHRATYRVGDTLEADILSTSPAGSAYLDVTREGRTSLAPWRCTPTRSCRRARSCAIPVWSSSRPLTT
jgi:5-hydroxyisourate hydrolase-like protein (transthyretin family)